jgi:hypothetical protein
MSINNNQEAVMGQAIPRQHPAVVLRSHFNLVRGLLAVAMVAVVGLAIAVVLVANDSDQIASPAAQSAPAVVQQAPALPDGTRYDGGPEEGTRNPLAAPAAPGTRYDGGPEEGSRGITPAEPPATRYDGGPEEGSRGPGFRTK